MNLSIIIPVYNEEKRLKRNLPEIKDYLSGFKGKYELLLIDDGSSDNTRKVIKNFSRKNRKLNIKLNKKRKNKGKGYSVKEGFFLSKYNWVLFSDVDLSTPITEADKLLKYIKKHDVIIASRDLPESKVIGQPFYRKIMGRIFSFSTLLITGLRVRDTQCGFKMFSRKSAEIIFKRQTISGFGFDPELLYIAKKHNFKIKEVPVIWTNDTESKVSSIKDSFQMLLDLFRIRLNDWLRKKYN
ncbi:glycosyltransferase family 2 protein [Candidatus Woesearchaeota archaeon]|nr:glycosyltransferase family 2 protein [Candidatus Woesearchaeota archaeon]